MVPSMAGHADGLALVVTVLNVVADEVQLDDDALVLEEDSSDTEMLESMELVED